MNEQYSQDDVQPETGEKARNVLEIMRKRRKACLDAESTTRQEALDDLKFASGEQWPEQIKNSRDIQHRPCLTINKTGKFLRQVINDSRQNKPSIHVFPVDGGADKDTATIFNGLMRDVEQRTDADLCYDTAIESAARCGEGYFRLITRYRDEMSVEQEPAFSRVRNPFSIHMDPAAQDPVGIDAMYAFVDSWMDKDEAEQEYGNDISTDLEQGTGESDPKWVEKGTILIAEYYSIEKDQPRTLGMLKTGAMVILEELEEPAKQEDIVAQRKVQLTRCIWRKVTGNKILEKTVFPCKYIPIFRVIGEEFDIEGNVSYRGLVRDMKDSQRMYNYWMTNATEKGALESKAPWVGAEGQFEGHEQQWKNANHVPFAYLEYKPVSLEGSPVPPPSRNVSTFTGQADVQMAQFSSNDMEETTGIYKSGLGQESNEKSGKAILARQRESDTGTFHYVDNLSRAIRHSGRVLCEIIPKLYSTETVVRIIGEDGAEDTVKINSEEKDEETQAIKRINDITIGRYDVRVAIGPSYTTRRLEAADSMIGFIKAVPPAGQAIMDLVAKTMDWPGAEDIAERLKKALPPELVQDEGDANELTPDKVQAMIQQVVQQMVQQFEQSLEQRDMKIKEFEAVTDRLQALEKADSNDGKVREMVAEALAEFIAQNSAQPAQGNMQ